MSALKLEYDNVIVGCGLAGLIASMRLRGRTILLSGGLGSTAVSSGVFSSMGRDAEAESWFLGLMSDTGCPYVRGNCITSSKVIKKGLVPASVNYEGTPMLIAFNEEKPGFKTINFMKGRSIQEIARTLDNDDAACEELGRVLSGIKGDSVLLPPVLGIDRNKEISEKLDVGEYAAAPSVLGLRLLRALEKKASGNERLDILDIVKVERLADGHVEGRMGTKGKREISVRAPNLFIATGGLLTGFTMSGDRLFEPLTGATVSLDVEADLKEKFLSGHPLMYKGIGPDLFINGFENVRAIGATACGFGLYEAMLGGYHAGDGI